MPSSSRGSASVTTCAGFARRVRRAAQRPAEAVSRRLLDEMGYAGDLAGARERLAAEAEAGADLHRVDLDTADLAGYERTLSALAA